MNTEFIKSIAYLLEKITGKRVPAPDLINDFLATHKYIKGDERRDFLQLIWDMIRAKNRLEWAYPDLNWQERIQKFIDCGLPDTTTAPDYIKWEVPEWFLAHVPNPPSELPPLLEVPPIILRAIGNRDNIIQQMQEEGLSVQPCHQSPVGIILSEYTNLKNTKVWKKGLIEIQDEGAQLVALDICVKPKQSVFDFCAGAGGKSLMFAQLMENKGFIQAYDITAKKLFELVKRANRAHINIIKIITKLEKPNKKFDHVVVDAPCSGCGTWRRSPNLRWHLTEKQLAHIVKLQSEILSRAEQYVKIGHHLSYITCSLTLDENEKQIEHFLSTHPNYQIIKQKRYSPYRTQTDGFFLCVMQKRA